MSAEKLIARLEGVRRTAPGRWMARCPTRVDRSPSLSIRELEDGRVLIYDFGGESVESVLAAVNLTFSDLFPTGPVTKGSPVKRRFTQLDVLPLVAFESKVVVIVVADLLSNKASTTDVERLQIAAQRLGHVAEACYVCS